MHCVQGLEVEAVAVELGDALMPTTQRVAALEAEIRCDPTTLGTAAAQECMRDRVLVAWRSQQGGQRHTGIKRNWT